MIKIETDLEYFVVIAAFRYALGRRSYAPSIIVSFLVKNWKKLSESDQKLIKKEIKEAIERGRAGDQYCDVPEWERVLNI